MQENVQESIREGSGTGWLVLLLLLALVVNFLYIDWGMPNHYTWAPDAIHPMLTIDAMDRGFGDGWLGKYPPFHYMLNALIYYPLVKWWYAEEVEALRSTKKQYLEDKDTSGAILSVSNPHTPVLTTMILLGRALNALISTLIVLAMFLAGREVFGVRCGLLSALITVFHPLVVFYAHTLNTEAPMFMWMGFALYCYFRAVKRQDAFAYFGLGLFGALACATKDQSLCMFVLLPPLLVWARAAHLSGGRPPLGALFRTLMDRYILLGACVFIAVFVLANNLLFNYEGYRAHLAFNSPGVNMLERVYPLTLSGTLALTCKTLYWLWVTATPVVSVLCLLGIFWVFKRRWYDALVVFLPAFSYFAVFIGYIGFLTPRYVTPMFMVFAIFGAKLFADFMEWRKAPRYVRAALAGGMILFVILLGASVDLLFKNDPRYEAETWVRENVPVGATLLIIATPDHTTCRVPPGRIYPPIRHVAEIDQISTFLGQTRADHVMVNLFPRNMGGKLLDEWLRAVTLLCDKVDFDVIQVFKPKFYHPAWHHLYLNPYVVFAKRR